MVHQQTPSGESPQVRAQHNERITAAQRGISIPDPPERTSPRPGPFFANRVESGTTTTTFAYVMYANCIRKSTLLKAVMASHGTQRRYVEGCRCEECTEAHRVSARDYRDRRASGQTRSASVVVVPPVVEPDGPGPVESGVRAEISDSAAKARPGLAQGGATVLAGLMDNPRATSQKPAAGRGRRPRSGQLRSASARGRRGGLAVVRTMTERRLLRTARFHSKSRRAGQAGQADRQRHPFPGRASARPSRFRLVRGHAGVGVGARPAREPGGGQVDDDEFTFGF